MATTLCRKVSLRSGACAAQLGKQTLRMYTYRKVARKCPRAIRQELEYEDAPAPTVAFNSQFQDVLREALERSGPDSLFGGGSHQEETRTPVVVEITSTALAQSKANLHSLMRMAADIEAAVEREQKQVERLQYVLERLQQDYAYYKVVEQRLQQQRAQN